MKFIFFYLLSSLFFFEAQAEGLFGIFMVVKGKVEILPPAKNPGIVKVGVKIFPGETVTTSADSRAKIVMSDRNVMNLSPDSKLTIEKYEKDVQGNKNVELKLDGGKVRNNVEEKYDGEKSKFLLKTPTAVAGVRGTQFVTGFDVKTQRTEIVTMKGQVSFTSVSNGVAVGAPVVVKKGETTSASPGAPPEAPKALPKSELKKIDQDSSAATKKENAEPSSEASEGSKNSEASNKEADSGPKEKSPDGPKEASNPGSDSGPKSEGSEAGPKEAKSPERGGDSPGGPKVDAPSGPSMIDRADMNTGIARDIKPPQPMPQMPVLPVAPRAPQPQPNPLLPNIIRDQTGKTKVIIAPK